MSDSAAKLNLHHREDCVLDPRTYTCTCGLLIHLLEIGTFKRYDASMCQVRRKNKSAFMPISEVLDPFLAALKERCAGLKESK